MLNVLEIFREIPADNRSIQPTKDFVLIYFDFIFWKRNLELNVFWPVRRNTR
jgi:hypothetical protein